MMHSPSLSDPIFKQLQNLEFDKRHLYELGIFMYSYNIYPPSPFDDTF